MKCAVMLHVKRSPDLFYLFVSLTILYLPAFRAKEIAAIIYATEIKL